MSELSTIGIITKSLELAKARKVGVQFTYFDVIELLGHIKALEEDSVLATHELTAYQFRIREFEQVSKKLEELEARWKIAETDVMDIVGGALSGDCEKYQYFDRNGNRYVRWGIVGNDLRAIFYAHTDITHKMSVVVKNGIPENKPTYNENANSLLRSAWMIANRNGEQTNWEAFKNAVYKELVAEHEIKTSTDNNKCWWTQESDPEVFPNLWRAGCGNSFWLDAEKPSDNHMKYCCYCGKEIAEGE